MNLEVARTIVRAMRDGVQAYGEREATPLQPLANDLTRLLLDYEDVESQAELLEVDRPDESVEEALAANLLIEALDVFYTAIYLPSEMLFNMASASIHAESAVNQEPVFNSEENVLVMGTPNHLDNIRGRMGNEFQELLAALSEFVGDQQALMAELNERYRFGADG